MQGAGAAEATAHRVHLGKEQKAMLAKQKQKKQAASKSKEKKQFKPEIHLKGVIVSYFETLNKK